jgi:hypothetical protein
LISACDKLLVKSSLAVFSALIAPPTAKSWNSRRASQVLEATAWTWFHRVLAVAKASRSLHASSANVFLWTAIGLVESLCCEHCSSFMRPTFPFRASPISERRVTFCVDCMALARLCRLVTVCASAVSATDTLRMFKAVSARTTLQAADSIAPKLLVHW